MSDSLWESVGPWRMVNDHQRFGGACRGLGWDLVWGREETEFLTGRMT